MSNFVVLIIKSLKLRQTWCFNKKIIVMKFRQKRVMPDKDTGNKIVEMRQLTRLVVLVLMGPHI